MAQQTPQKGRQISLVCRNHLSRNFCRRYEWPSSRLLCRRIYDLEHKSHSMGLFFLPRFGTGALGKKHFTKRQRFTSTSNFRCHQPPPSSLGFTSRSWNVLPFLFYKGYYPLKTINRLFFPQPAFKFQSYSIIVIKLFFTTHPLI